jgi:hypothetical protein
MAKGQVRGNRETKKPKQSASALPWDSTGGKNSRADTKNK